MRRISGHFWQIRIVSVSSPSQSATNTANSPPVRCQIRPCLSSVLGVSSSPPAGGQPDTRLCEKSRLPDAPDPSLAIWKFSNVAGKHVKTILLSSPARSPSTRARPDVNTPSKSCLATVANKHSISLSASALPFKSFQIFISRAVVTIKPPCRSLVGRSALSILAIFFCVLLRLQESCGIRKITTRPPTAGPHIGPLFFHRLALSTLQLSDTLFAICTPPPSPVAAVLT